MDAVNKLFGALAEFYASLISLYLDFFSLSSLGAVLNLGIFLKKKIPRNQEKLAGSNTSLQRLYQA